jgi:hypothetical protein
MWFTWCGFSVFLFYFIETAGSVGRFLPTGSTGSAVLKLLFLKVLIG